MDTQSRTRALGALVIAVALAGCAGGTVTTPASSPAVTQHAPASTARAAPTTGAAFAPTVAPSPSPSPGPLDGTMTAVGLPESWTGCGAWGGEVRVADSRAAGAYHSLVCTVDRPDGGIDFRGVWTLWNADGTWDGEFAGGATAAGDHVMDAVAFGTGAYTGLRLNTHSEAGRDDSVWTISGSIEPGTTPGPAATPPGDAGEGWTEITGTRSCVKVISAPTETLVGGVTQRRGEVGQCNWSTTDPRLTAPDLTLASTDLRADGAGKGWGMLAIRTADGLWLGSYSLDRQRSGRTTITTALRGHLAWEGFSYQDVQVGKGDTWRIAGWLGEGG